MRHFKLRYITINREFQHHQDKIATHVHGILKEVNK